MQQAADWTCSSSMMNQLDLFYKMCRSTLNIVADTYKPIKKRHPLYSYHLWILNAWWRQAAYICIAVYNTKNSIGFHVTFTHCLSCYLLFFWGSFCCLHSCGVTRASRFWWDFIFLKHKIIDTEVYYIVAKAHKSSSS